MNHILLNCSVEYLYTSCCCCGAVQTIFSSIYFYFHFFRAALITLFVFISFFVRALCECCSLFSILWMGFSIELHLLSTFTAQRAFRIKHGQTHTHTPTVTSRDRHTIVVVVQTHKKRYIENTIVMCNF